MRERVEFDRSGRADGEAAKQNLVPFVLEQSGVDAVGVGIPNRELPTDRVDRIDPGMARSAAALVPLVLFLDPVILTALIG